ncbi:MAG: molybdate transport system ATP-binding protein [Maribacter sp.]|jgi:molybdate transport system ATP-binding protein
MIQHWAILINNASQKSTFIAAILGQTHPNFKAFKNQKGALFSPLAIASFVNQEERYGTTALKNAQQPLKTMSSGEQKKALLHHILASQPDYIILDNPFDNLDTDFQAELKQFLTQKAQETSFIQLVSRKSDILPFINSYGLLKKLEFTQLNLEKLAYGFTSKTPFKEHIPKPIERIDCKADSLIEFKNVSISYAKKQILKNISWKIHQGDFWQLKGKNGSGKTTILSMIVGDNPKAFGQDIYIFGQKKGSGESVWEIKEKIGYFSSNMTDKFRGRHSTEHMLISGFRDSIGLYIKPTETQKQKSKEWLHLLDFWDQRHTLFKDLSLGQQRLLMTARAMVKHPPLLILDEPTAGMDDASAALLVALVNKIASETNTSIVFVSHRDEPGLSPISIFKLNMTPNGSEGIIN